MSKRILVGLVAIAVVLAVALWATWLPSGSTTDPNETTTPDVADLSADETTKPESLENETTERVTQDTAPKKTPEGVAGRLVVEVVWHDDTPAANVGVRCSGRYPQRLPGGRRLVVSDAEGLAIFDGLGPRKVSVSSNRGGSAKGEVFADREATTKLKIPKGVDIAGVVVDASNTPVADADIWLTTGWTNWLGGRVVATSDEAGKFFIRSSKKDQSVGAIKQGYERSKLADLDTHDRSKPPVDVRLELVRGGGSAKIRVVDRRQKPARGALVAIGKMVKHFKQRSGMAVVEAWTPRVVTCDEAGLAVAHGFPAGVHPVSIRHDGHPIWNGEIEIVTGRTAEKVVHLVAPVVAHGTAKDAQGKPVAEALVRAIPEKFDEVFLQSGQFDYDAVLGYPMTVTDAQGRYRLETIAPGQIYLHAQTPRKRDRGSLAAETHRTKKTIQAGPGTTIEWNPLLSPGHTIEGVVQYRNGSPMGNVFVTAKEQKTGKRNVIHAGKEGKFRFVNLESCAYTISVQLWSPPKGSKPVLQKDVWPDQAKLRLAADFDPEVKLPPGSVRGQIQDNHKRIKNPSALLVQLVSEKNFWNTARDMKDGKFKFKRVRPGRYKIVAQSGEDVIYVGDWFDVASKSERDVGVIWTQPKGSVVFRITRKPGTENIEPTLHLRPTGSIHATKIEPGTASVFRHDNISLGTHRLSLYGKGILSQRREVTVPASGLIEIPITLEAAVLTSVRVVFPKNAKDGEMTVRIKDATGKETKSWKVQNFSSGENPWSSRLRLPAGRQTLEAETTTGLRGAKAFVVKLDQKEGPTVTVTMR